MKAKIKQLLIEYCDLDEDSYHINDEVDMDEYLEILEKELKAFTDRIKEESQEQIQRALLDLEAGMGSRVNGRLAQSQQKTTGDELQQYKTQIDNLKAENQKLEDENDRLLEIEQDLQIKIDDLNEIIEERGDESGESRNTQEHTTGAQGRWDLHDLVISMGYSWNWDATNHTQR